MKSFEVFSAAIYFIGLGGVCFTINSLRKNSKKIDKIVNDGNVIEEIRKDLKELVNDINRKLDSIVELVKSKEFEIECEKQSKVVNFKK